MLSNTDPKARLVEKMIECNEARSTVDTCAQDCFNKEKAGLQCIGFIGHESGRCILCQPRHSISSGNTDISNGDIL